MNNLIHSTTASYRRLRKGLLVLVVTAVCSTAAYAQSGHSMAGGCGVPELNPSALASALTLLSGGFLMLTGRSR